MPFQLIFPYWTLLLILLMGGVVIFVDMWWNMGAVQDIFSWREKCGKKYSELKRLINGLWAKGLFYYPPGYVQSSVGPFGFFTVFFSLLALYFFTKEGVTPYLDWAFDYDGVPYERRPHKKLVTLTTSEYNSFSSGGWKPLEELSNNIPKSEVDGVSGSKSGTTPFRTVAFAILCVTVLIIVVGGAGK